MNGIGRIFQLPAQLGITRQSRSTDKDPQQGGQGYSHQQKQRNPNEEEAKKAFAILLAMESVQKNGLQVELVTDESVKDTINYILLVKDKQGVVLRGVRGGDILRLLEQGTDGEHKESGHILDRRI